MAEVERPLSRATVPSLNAHMKLAVTVCGTLVYSEDEGASWHSPGPSYQVQSRLYSKALHVAVAVSSQALQGL